MQTEKRYMLVLYKPESSEHACGCTVGYFEARFEVHHNLTESEAYAIVLRHEVEKDEQDSVAEYCLFDESPNRAYQLDWYNRLLNDVPEKRKMYRDKCKHQRDAEILKAATAARDEGLRRERTEYERLKAKFEKEGQQ